MGWPIAHSLSPLIHQTWAEREGNPVSYERIPVEPGYDAFAVAMDRLRQSGYRGVNITIPHKDNALRYADAQSDAARAIGAANMLTFTGPECRADNSDAFGFAASLNGVGGVENAEALVLGAGGAARAVVYALTVLCGVASVTICNRTRDKADAIAGEFDAETVDWSQRDAAVRDADLVVNATALGMVGRPPLLIGEQFKADAIVCDIVYAPLETPLLAAARAAALRTVDGLGMLMHQAAPGYRAWLGRDAIVDGDLRERLVEALANRGGQ